MQELNQVIKIIKQAGQAAMQYYNSDNEVSYKQGDSPVTEADLAAEKVILEGLKQFNYGILSEETDEENDRLNQQKVWIIDPLDGTKDFIQKTGDFSIIIGLVENQKAVLGVVYQPVLDIVYFATKGGGAYMQKKSQPAVRLHVSDTEQLSQMKILASRNHLGDVEVEFAKDNGIENFVRSGSAGLKIAKVASAEGDIYMNTSDRTFEWDICGGTVIINEAGGQITDMQGNEILFNKKNPRNLQGYIVSNGKRHEEIVEKLNSKS